MSKTKLKNEAQLLELFVAQDDLRPSLMHPFEQNGYICASDTHIVIRVAKDMTKEQYVQQECPNVERVMIEPKPQLVIYQREIENALVVLGLGCGPGFLRFCNCSECNGTGEVEYTYRHKSWSDESYMMGDCPICGGDGNAPNGVDKYAELCGHAFDGYHLILLLKAMQMLNVDAMPVTPTGNRGFLFQPCEGIDIVLMSQQLNKSKAKYKIKTMDI